MHGWVRGSGSSCVGTLRNPCMEEHIRGRGGMAFQACLHHTPHLAFGGTRPQCPDERESRLAVWALICVLWEGGKPRRLSASSGSCSNHGAPGEATDLDLKCWFMYLALIDPFSHLWHTCFLLGSGPAFHVKRLEDPLKHQPQIIV